VALFKVCFDVAPVKMYLDGTWTRCGFVNNLYVWAGSESQAIVAARSRLDTALSERAAKGHLDYSDAIFNVESTERSTKFWKLARPEGFVFYRQDS
jgi:hypothetical protein